MPVALAARAILKVPTAVLAAPAPSLIVRVAVVPEVETAASVPALGTLVSVQGAVSVEGASGSLKLAVAWSILPLPSVSFIASVPATRTGLALSVGLVVVKLAWLPAASRMPVALVASAIVKLLTAVSGAPAPSVIVRVAAVPEVVTEARLPALGTLLSVQGVGAGAVGGERFGEGRDGMVDFAVGVGVLHHQRQQCRRDGVLGARDRGRARGVAVAAGRPRPRR